MRGERSAKGDGDTRAHLTRVTWLGRWIHINSRTSSVRPVTMFLVLLMQAWLRRLVTG